MTKPKSEGRRVNITDVANASGVSRATVSLVLRQSPLVSDRTRERVERKIKEMGYLYNRAAANLRTRTSNTVALLINDLSNPFFAEFASGVGDTLMHSNCVPLLGCSDESADWQLTILESLMEHRPAGIILSPAEKTDGRKLRLLLGDEPVLVFNRELPDSHWDFLSLDNETGAKLAAEHLLAQGHRKILFFGGHADSSSCQQRRSGYLAAMRAAGLPTQPEWLVESAPTRIDAKLVGASILDEMPGVTAAVCYNDNVALGLKLALQERGVRPGEDFALTGFDDIPEAAQTTPSLTTVAVEPRVRGQQAAEMLLERVRDPAAPVRKVTAPVRLIVRDSSCHIKE